MKKKGVKNLLSKFKRREEAPINRYADELHHTFILLQLHLGVVVVVVGLVTVGREVREGRGVLVRRGLGGLLRSSSS